MALEPGWKRCWKPRKRGGGHLGGFEEGVGSPPLGGATVLASCELQVTENNIVEARSESLLDRIGGLVGEW